MTDAASPAAFDIEAQRAQIQRAQEETGKFVAEQRKLMAEAAKLATEQLKMSAEAAKLGRDRALAPWQVAFSGMAAGAAFFGAGAAFIKLLGP
ncbi:MULTISPECIES: hypothetical protein [unclassified Methylobacterium]|uniref:hypothetical protein n=1 Tax=unclassified Methylobacterium TaxID=2615210 RepID=UPI0011C1E89E|nr:MULTISPECIES: hypothetical protein [unclassified Methylobacterium]QEE41904.1 hypothetical protein FVA80_26200 [Methylobacterium sp. WL1]TXN53536.1 hypothetical protein FV241_27800 [Methylobacterium sp. WL2]